MQWKGLISHAVKKMAVLGMQLFQLFVISVGPFKIGKYGCCIMNIFLRKIIILTFTALCYKEAWWTFHVEVSSVIVWCGCGTRPMQYAGVEASGSDGIEENRESLFRTENINQAIGMTFTQRTNDPAIRWSPQIIWLCLTLLGWASFHHSQWLQELD